MQDSAALPVTVIANATNRGFPAAINQGLQVARGEFLVLLNNDVVVTDAWLNQLIGLANARMGSVGAVISEEVKEELERRGNVTVIDFEAEPREREGGAFNWSGPQPPLPPLPKGGKVCSHVERVETNGAERDSIIGLVGPMSNYAAAPQLVDEVPYRDMAEMHGFARRWRDEHRGQWFTVPKLSGFCLLMKRVVYDKIGGLDERFGIGFFDDDDLAERARRAGFELAVAHDLFVHHFGSRTFAGNGIDAEKLLDENAQRFAAKWGLPGTNGKRIALRPFVDSRFQTPGFRVAERSLESRLQAAILSP